MNQSFKPFFSQKLFTNVRVLNGGDRAGQPNLICKVVVMLFSEAQRFKLVQVF